MTTLGKKAIDAINKGDGYLVSPIDIEKSTQEEYIKEIHKCVDINKKQFTKEFYITVISKKEFLLPNVMRKYYLAQQTCPTPTFDQTVYHYNIADENLQFIWVIPDRDTAIAMMHNPLQVKETELFKYVLDFYDGTLLAEAKRRSGEKSDSNILEGVR